jgi:hypothetical protein
MRKINILSKIGTAASLLFLFVALAFQASAQTDRIPIAEGAFSNPGGFAGNNWSVSNGVSPNHQWIVSSGHALGAPFSGDAAFVSNNGTAYAYTVSSASSNIFFWRDVTVPAGETVMSLTFDWNQQGENSWDLWQVFVAPTTINPVGNNTHPGSGTNNVPAPIAGATYIGNGSALAGIQSFSAAIPQSFAGTTFRLIFSWKNDGVLGTQPPAAIDNIRLTSAAPITYTATAQGGLWNSPATWVGGVVPPAGNDIVIPAGSTVTVNQVLNYRHLTVDGNLNFTTVTTAAPFHTFSGNVTVGATGNLYWSNATASLNQINIGGNLTNNGYINAVTGFMTFNGTGNQEINGSGTFEGTGGRGVIRGILAVNSGTFTLNQTQNITVTQQINHTANDFVTNGRLRIDNAVDVFQNSVSQLITTNMGSGYTTAPVVLGQSVSAWTPNGTATANSRYFSGNDVYLCTTGGTFGASAPVNTTPVTETNGTATVLWIGNLGNLGNAFQVTAVTAGVQYYCGDNLYICTVAGTPSAAAPPTHTSGTAVSGTATFAYVGTVAKASLNWDATTQTVRSLNLVSGGSGYQSIPGITISNTGAGSGAAFSSVMFQSAGPANSLALKATASTYTGSADPRHSNAPAGAAGNGVYSATAASYGWYNSAVAVGFTAPPLVNLVTAQGSGYTSAPSVTVTGGTLLSGTALNSGSFQVNVADGRVISVYCNSPGTAVYSVPPTISLTGGGGAGATIDWGTAYPSATANLSNGSSGYITSIDITNNGYGYVSAPSVGLRAAVAGEVAALLPSCRLQQLNIQWGFFLPQTTNPNNNSIMALVPSNGRVNAIAVSSGAQTFTSNIEVTASAPLPTFAGVIDMGGSNNLRFSNPDYAGTAGGVGAFVTNGSVELSLRGGALSATRTFPIGGGTGATAHFVHVTGGGTPATGYTYTGMRVSRFDSPSGTVSPAGNITGIRGVRVDLVGTGTLNNLNTTRTMQMFWNILDNLVSNNPSLYVADATAPTGPWTVRSTSTGSGPLPTTGSRTTATAAPGPFAVNNTMYFAWVNNGFTPPPALQYDVVRTTGNTYNSIAPVALGGDGTGISTTFTSGDDAISPVIDLNVTGNSFTYQGQLVTGFRISTNGNIQLQTAGGATGSTAFTNTMNDNAQLNMLAPFFDDLTANPNTGAGATNNIRYKITGTAPNRTLIVEWANFTVFGAAGPQLYFQVEMVENTGVIRFNYGDMQLFNGTNDHRYSYSCGIKGRYTSSYPQAGQVFALTYENSNYWSHVQTQLANYGANGLLVSPEPRSSYTFTPGPGYVLPPIPGITVPANDDVGGAEAITALSAFPSNIAWNIPQNKSRIYTTRGATASPQPLCGGPANAKDVWFSFVANEPNVTARIYASGGYIPRVQMLDASLNNIDCQVGTKGGQIDAIGTGLTIGNTYYVRVYHDLVGNSGVFTGSSVANGNVGVVTINDGGTNYTVATTGNPLGARFNVSGGGGNTFVGAVTSVTGGVINNGTFDGGNDYTSVPTIQVESPDWGLTGQFAIVIYAPPINDECAGAIELTNLTNTSCVNLQNSRTGISTASATASADPLGTCSSGADDDLWYKFVAVGTTTVVSVQGNGGFNPALQIWSGTTCGTKVVVNPPAGGCVNNTGVNGLEEIALTTTIGTTYYVRVYHAGAGFGGPGANFDICVIGSVPACASGFTPPDLATDQGSTTVLSWSAVTGATGYDVYFSTIANDVNTFAPAALVSSNQPGTTYNATGLTMGTTYYWAIVPRNGNGPATGCTSQSFTTSTSPCTFLAYGASNATSAADEDILNVTFGTLNNSSTCASLAPGPGSIQNQYSNYTTSVAAPSVMQGDTVAFSVSIGTCGGNYTNAFRIFIDWNADGDFLDAGETAYTSPAVSGPHTQTGNIVVPMTATPGITRMRVVNVETATPTSITSTGTYTWGETEDYCIDITTLPACSGTPAPANTLSSTALACPNLSFTLSLSTTYNFSGITYQWQSAPSNSGPWTNISGATNATRTQTQSSATWYRCVVTCTNGGASINSTPVQVNMETNLTNCYCIPTFTLACTNVYIQNVSINTLNKSSSCGGNMPTNFTYTPPLGTGNTTTLDKGATYSMTVNIENGLNNNAVGVWFDWNGNLSFNDPGEYYTDNLLIPGQHTITVNVPMSSLTGYVRMRVRTTFNNLITAGQSCSNLNEGETEDYYVNVVPATPRTLGTVTATQQTGTAGQGSTNNTILRLNFPVTGSIGTLTVTSVTVNYTGTTSADIPANGVSLWSGTVNGPVTQVGTSQSLIANSATFSGLSVALNPATTYLWLRFNVNAGATVGNLVDFTIPANGIVVASAGGATTYLGNALLDPAGNKVIDLNYCAVSTSQNSCTSIDYINSVVVNTLNNTSGCNTGGSPNYTNFPPTGSNTTTLDVGSTYTATVGVFSNFAGEQAGIWVDWNKNGVFTDPGEFFACSGVGVANVVTPVTANIVVPINAVGGATRMRVRSNWNVALVQTDACLNWTFGETEDYTINVAPVCTWLGTTNNWFTASNWSCGFVPTATTTAEVPVTANNPSVTGAATAKNLTVNSGVTITLNGTSTLTITGNWTGGSATPSSVVGDGRVRMISTSGQINGKTSFRNLEIASAAGNTTIGAGGSNAVEITRALLLASGTLITNGNLTTKSTSVNTAAFIDNFSTGFTGTMTGNATIERFIHRTGFSYLGTPINNPQANEIGNNVGGVNGTGGNYSPLLIQPGCQFLAPGSPYSNFMRYNESIVTNCNLEGWEVITDGTSILENGRGYSINVPTAGTVIDATGAVNLGAVSYNGMSNTPTNTTTQKGLNMLSNPYPSPLNLDAFKAANPDVGGVAYVWNGGNMVSILMNDGTPSYVGLYQGFQVIWNGVVSGGVVNFANSMRWAWPTTLFYDEPNVDHKMDIVVTNANGDKDQTLIYFADGREDGWEIEHDGYKFNSAAGIPTLYTRIEGISDQVSVNALPLTTQTRKIPMGLRPGSSGNFTFDFQSLSTLPANMKVFLEDTKTGTMQNMRTNATYSFGMNETENPDRFFIHLMIDGNTAGTENTPAKGNISMWAADKTININFGHDIAGKVDVKIYDLAGKLIDVVEYQNVQKGMKEILSNRVVKGIYLVNIVGKDVNVSKKVFID